MATYYGKDLRKSGAGDRGQLQKYLGYIEFGEADEDGVTVSTVNTNDLYTFRNKLPDKFRLVGGEIWGVELDTNASPAVTVKVGNTDNTGGFLNTTLAPTATQQNRWKFDGALVGSILTNKTFSITVVAGSTTDQTAGRFFAEVEFEGL